MTFTEQGKPEPRHLGELFFQRVAALRDRTFIKLQRDGRFEELSWNVFGTMVRELMLGLDRCGLDKGERVAILAENRVEWLCADMATLAAGFPNVIISPGLSDNLMGKLLHHAEPCAAFVENQSGLDRISKHQKGLSALRYLFVIPALGERGATPGIMGFDSLLDHGRHADAGVLQSLLARVQPGDPATIMYTSGSTGEPKGVIRTQENILANISSGNDIPLSGPEELTVLVLSLNHLFGRFGFHKSLATGRTMAVVEATERDIDLATIKALSPTSMSLVPRVIEIIWEKILDQHDNRTAWQMLEQMAGGDGAGTSPEVKRRYEGFLQSLRRSTRETLGPRIKYVSYGGAPMRPAIVRFFRRVGLPLVGSYGSTECGGVTVCGLEEGEPGDLGRPFSNVEIRIAGDGELLVRGPTVSPGYFKNPHATAEAFDREGWYHTGDLGEITAGGSLRIIGRKKDVFNCSDGSNIYPQQIEVLLESDPLIRQAILLGDRRPFIAALIVPDMEAVAREGGSSSTAKALILSRVERINENLEDFEKIRDVALLFEDFPPAIRNVTVFQKVKIDRKSIEETYRQEIRKIYGRGSEDEGRQREDQ